jgi:hypothetical protein
VCTDRTRRTKTNKEAVSFTPLRDHPIGGVLETFQVLRSTSF